MVFRAADMWFLLLVQLLAILLCQGKNVTYDDVVQTMAYFKCQGPMLVICPEVPSLLLAKHLSLERTLTASVDKEGKGADKTMYRSYILCATDSANAFVKFFEDIKSHGTKVLKKQWIVLCGDATCSYLTSLGLINIGDNVLFVNLDTSNVIESFTVNDLTRTHAIGKIFKVPSSKKSQMISMTQRRSNLQGLELVTLIDVQYPHIVFFESYDSKTR